MFTYTFPRRPQLRQTSLFCYCYKEKGSSILTKYSGMKVSHKHSNEQYKLKINK